MMEADELRKKLHPGDEEPDLKQKVKKHSLAIQIIVTVVIIALIFTACAIMQAPTKEEVAAVPQACFKHDVCLDLIVVTTSEELEIGLSNYSSLPEGRGMLFIFEEEGLQRMWMKDMDFPIDMFWLDRKGKILHIEKKALPCEPPMCEIFEPMVRAKYVLETNEGFAHETNLFDGDKVELRFIEKYKK